MAKPPRETTLMWPDPKKGPWWIHVWWRIQYGVPTPVGISLRSWITNQESEFSGNHNRLPYDTDDAELPHVDGRLMRELPMGALIDASRALLGEGLRHDLWATYDNPQFLAEGLAKGMGPQFPGVLAHLRESVAEDLAAVEGPKHGRDLGNDHYREVAQVYAAAVQAGEPPTVAVAEHFTVEKSSAAKKVARARQRGFLPPTTKGRIGPLSKDL